jgi:hypothetical protein
MNVNGSFTVAEELDPNLLFADITAEVLSFSFNDGVFTYDSNTPPDFKIFIVSTDASGNIISWDIAFQELDNPPPNTVLGDEMTFLNTFVVEDNTLFGRCAQLFPNVCTYKQVGSAFAFGPGSWENSTAAVPEPHPFVLIGFGLVGLGFFGRKHLDSSRRAKNGVRRSAFEPIAQVKNLRAAALVSCRLPFRPAPLVLHFQHRSLFLDYNDERVKAD